MTVFLGLMLPLVVKVAKRLSVNNLPAAGAVDHDVIEGFAREAAIN